MKGRGAQRILIACMFAVVLLTALFVMWVLDASAHINAGAGFDIGLLVGLFVSVAFVIGLGMVRKRRSVKLETSLDLVDVPVWRLVLSRLVPTWHSRQSLAMLPVASDLPGSKWRAVEQCTSRIGFLGGQVNSPVSQRARSMGSVLAVRIFEKEDSKLWWAFRAYPVANEDDAVTSVTQGRLVAPVASKVTAIAEEREVDDVVIPGVHPLWAYEREYVTASGSGWTKILRGSVGLVVFEIYSSGSPGAADWQELSAMTEVFVQRIRSAQLAAAHAS